MVNLVFPNRWRLPIPAVAVSVAVSAGMLFSAAAEGQSSSGTLRLNGTVAPSCTVAVTDLGQSLNLVAGETGKQVGTVVENCNAGGGYTLSVASAGQGSLTSSGAGTAPVAFSLGYDGQSSALTSTLTLSRAGASFARAVPVTVNVPASAQRAAGSYSDTLTITIAAK
jgi:spore coat protein U-like protein